MSEEQEQTEETQEEATTEETQEEVAEVEEEVQEVVEEEEEPVHELSRPAVIDLKALLQPISDDEPSGEYMRYSGVYDEIGEARRQDEDLAQGDWQVELKVADYRKVIELANSVIEKESKDLQISAWLSEALVKQHGFEGLRDSLKLLSGIQNKFWETFFPEIDEGDMEGRANALSWMDEETALGIKEASITPEGYSFFDWEDSRKFKIPDNIESLDYDEQEKIQALQDQASRENRVTSVKWDKSTAKSNRAFYEELNVAIEECWAEYNKLNLSIEEKFDINQAPSLNRLKKALDDIQTQTNKILEQKRIEEPDPEEDVTETAEVGEDGETKASSSSGKGSLSSTAGTIQNRKEALKRLSELAAFFRKTEPHSPVSYLVNRAVKWGNMPLDSWLKDVISDETILFQIKQTLGISENEGSSSDDGWGDGGETNETESSSDDSW